MDVTQTMSVTRTVNGDDSDRLGFGLFLAVAVHAMVIFGIGFQFQNPPQHAPTLEVTLAQYSTETAPEQADYLAQSNQVGSGEAEQKQELTNDHIPDVSASQMRDSQPVAPPVPQQISGQPTAALVTTTGESRTQTHKEIADDPGEMALEPSPDPPAIAQEIASLRAKLDVKKAEYSRMPRVLRLTAASTRAADQAAYLRYWVDQVEEAGNRNYPEEARRKRIFGDLRIAVTILPDGSVEGVEILLSSGERVLDQAAVRIIRSAAPFARFPQEMGKWDKLEIIRTWHFVPGNRLLTQ